LADLSENDQPAV